jgi:hypothetical protein
MLIRHHARFPNPENHCQHFPRHSPLTPGAEDLVQLKS